MIRYIVRVGRRYPYIKEMIKFIYMFVFEVLSNDVVSRIPCYRIRHLFYKYICNIRLSDKAYILRGCYIYPDLSDLEIGDNTIINNNVILDRRAGLYIGRNVNISREAAIYTGGHEIDSQEFAYYGKSVVVYDYVWIGTRAMIMPGVTIGKGAVVLPGAVVTHDCEPFTVYGGVPAKKIRKRTCDLKYELNWRSYFV